MKIVLPTQVKKIIEELEAHGYEGYAVGGCVRDILLGRKPDDWDITTSAQPAQVKEVFKRTIDTGIQHGTVTVLMEKEAYEVTTYRVDGEYLDGRHPSQVEFTSSLIEDLRRRDFTINAMAYNEGEGLIDLFEGASDMEKKCIRCVGDAKERFGEDALRILRAVRFGAQLSFEIEPDTLQAAKELAFTLHKISAERIQTELVKLLTSRNPKMWNTVFETGISNVIMPEYDKVEDKEMILKALPFVAADKVLRLSVLLHSMGEKTTSRILKRLKFDNDTYRQVTRIVKYVNLTPDLNEEGVRKSIYQVGQELFGKLLQVQEGIYKGQGDMQGLQRMKSTKELEAAIIAHGDCLTLFDLAVNGQDLLENGVPQGKMLGTALQYLLMDVLENPEHNQKKILLEILKKSDLFI